MSFTHDKKHISLLLERSSLSKAGLTLYTRVDDELRPTWLRYGDLQSLATHRAESLKRYLGLRPGQILLIHFKSHLENIVWFWATVLAGAIPALSTPLVNDSVGRQSHFRHLHQLLHDPVVITNQELAESDFADNQVLKVATIEAIHNDTHTKPVAENKSLQNGTPTTQAQCQSTSDTPTNYNLSCSNDASKENMPMHHMEDLAVLMLTSGSTGNAKAVCLSHRQIFASLEGKLAATSLPQESAIFNWIGFDHVANLTEAHLCAMFAGIDQVHAPAVELLSDPLLFLRLLTRHRVSRTFAPNFFLHRLQEALEAASPEKVKDIELSHLLWIISGGEANDLNVCVQLTKQLHRLGATQNNIIVPAFGMTETCAGSIYNKNCPQANDELKSNLVSLGTCVPGIEVRISALVSESAGTEATESTPMEGEVELRGPIIFEKYFNDDKATQNAFTPDGWFRTGDVGFVDAGGNLTLVGRSKEIININGVKHLPHEIESAIGRANIAGVVPSFCVCFGHFCQESKEEEMYIVYQYDYDAHDAQARMRTLQAIVQIVMVFTGARPHVVPVAAGKLEKTTLGKLSRAKIRNALMGGKFKDDQDLDSAMLQSLRPDRFAEPEDDTQRTLMQVYSQVLSSDRFDAGIDTHILDTGVNSVDLIRLKKAVEEAVNVKDIPLITIISNTTIRSLAAALRPLTNNKQLDIEYEPVVTLQGNGSKTPLWLIHPGIGEVLVFLGLAQYFPDRPVYALRARGFNPGEKPFTDLSDVLQTYYYAIKKKQPKGPYAIAGYSYGSMLAFEMAKILESESESVRFLASFNLPPHIKTRMQQLDWTAGLLHISFFCRMITESRSLELRDKLRGLPRSTQIDQVLSESDPERRAELGMDEETLMTWTNVSFALQKIGWDYDPSGAVSHMDVFYCQPLKEVARTREEYRHTKLCHWADFVRNGVEFHEVAGEHYTMIDQDHVPEFQRILKCVLTARGL